MEGPWDQPTLWRWIALGATMAGLLCVVVYFTIWATVHGSYDGLIVTGEMLLLVGLIGTIATSIWAKRTEGLPWLWWVTASVGAIMASILIGWVAYQIFPGFRA